MTPATTAHPEPLHVARNRFLVALLEGDAVTADAELGVVLDAGTPKAQAFAEVVAPALHAVGDLWARAELAIADEHMASAVARRACERVAEPPRPPVAQAPSAVVACAPGERHDLSARMVADCLTEAGWRVSYLGADAPAEELATFALRRRAQLLALSVTLPERLDGVREIARLLGEGPERPRLVVGGSGVAGVRDPRQRLGADEVLSDLEAFSRSAVLARRAAVG